MQPDEMALLTKTYGIGCEWARKKADWYDPHVDAYDELLREVNKATLTFKNRVVGGLDFN